jgi:tetratricopeptide (TPR) repeat protein
MAKLKTFVGHSFNEEDSSVIATFLKYFDSLKDIGFEWEHAERAVATKAIDDKVIEMMEGKNLFIGIFTRKRKQIGQSHLEPCLWNKQKLKAPAEKYSWTTSDWIIQESGYALGKGMKIIFITEEGIEPVGGLQGNLEYIPFNRKNITQSFSKLNESITSLLATDTVSTQKETKDIPPEDIYKKSESEKRDGEKSTLFGKLLRSIKENNEEDEKAAIKEMLRGDSDEYKQVETKGFYYWLRYSHGKKDILDDLVKLSKGNPNHPNPHIWLGRLYEEYKQFDKACEQFISASELTSNDSEKTTFICKAAKTLMEDGKPHDAQKIIIKRLRTISDNSCDELFELYHTLAMIQKRNNSTERYLSLTEKALELKPSDSSTRFDLAYAYSKNKNHIMALYHYKILCNSTSNDANWNNLGVALSELELSGKSIDAYLKSKELGGTTAVGNLAYKLIDAGFYSEAKKYLQEALKHDNCSSNVSSALSNLESKQNKEDDKEQELSSDLLSRIKFRVKYAEAYTKITAIPSLQGKWKTKHGDVQVEVLGSQFTATGQFERPLDLGLADIYARNPYRNIEKSKINVSINYKGVIVNGVIDYQLSVTTKPSNEPDKLTKAGTLLGGLINSNEVTVKYDRRKSAIMSQSSKKDCF